MLYRGQKEALAEFLPLDARELDHLRQRAAARLAEHLPADRDRREASCRRLFNTPLDQAEIDFENEGGETYICGNPPYQGSVNQTAGQKEDMAQDISLEILKRYKDFDYVAAFIFKAAKFNKIAGSRKCVCHN